MRVVKKVSQYKSISKSHGQFGNGAGDVPSPEAISSPAANTPDVEVSCHGSIYIFTPLTPAAREWVADFLPEDAQQWAGGTVVEHRFIADIVQGAQRDGLSVVPS